MYMYVCVCMQEFQEEISPIKDDVTHMNQLASTFGPHDIQLSPINLERIDDLNTRWRLLQVRSFQMETFCIRSSTPSCFNSNSVESIQWSHSGGIIRIKQSKEIFVSQSLKVKFCLWQYRCILDLGEWGLVQHMLVIRGSTGCTSASGETQPRPCWKPDSDTCCKWQTEAIGCNWRPGPLSRDGHCCDSTRRLLSLKLAPDQMPVRSSSHAHAHTCV